METIRRARELEIQQIREIANISWPATYASILSEEQLAYMLNEMYASSALNEQMTKGNQHFYLLIKDTATTGFASFTPPNLGCTYFKVNKFYTLPAYQGKGLGKIFMTLIIDQIKTHGGTTIRLNVNRYNPALHFYQKCGFKIVSEEDVAIGKYWMNDYVMEMNI